MLWISGALFKMCSPEEINKVDLLPLLNVTCRAT